MINHRKRRKKGIFMSENQCHLYLVFKQKLKSLFLQEA